MLNWKEFLKYSDTFIETGTCFGRSVHLALEAGYKHIRSVEAQPELYNASKETFKNNSSVMLWLGKSIDCLEQMLHGINKPCVFWLDAHVTGAVGAGFDDWKEKGDKSEYHQHNVLVKELQIILKHRNDHIILIDDQNGENQDNEFYKQMLLTANPNYKFRFEDEQMGEMFYKEKILVAYL